MVTIISLFLIFSGLLAAIVHARNNEVNVRTINYFIFGIGAVLLSADFFEIEGDLNPYLFPSVLVSIIAIHFVISEITKQKTSFFWIFLPIIFALLLGYFFPFTSFSFLGYFIDTNEEVLLIALLASVTPFLTHLAKLGISNLVIRFGSIIWAENEENYLESLVSYAFIGGVAALGTFLIGPLGFIIAATFYLSATFVSRNKLGFKNDIFLSASGALWLIVYTILLLQLGGFKQLNFLRGEVLEGAFVAGFMVIAYHLFLQLARFNRGNWKYIFTFLALLLPLLSVLVIGFAYNAFERLGGVLSLGGMLISMAILSVTFALFKNANFVPLKIFSVGLIFFVTPFILPVEQVSSISLESLGIKQSDTAKDDDKTVSLDFQEILGSWLIDEEVSKVFFELGPEDGRTKGEFKTFRGEMTIKEEITNSNITVILPVKALTTYISVRDQELMTDEYFDEQNFPEMQFQSKKLVKKDTHYEWEGSFTMLGITNPLTVEMSLIGVGEENGQKVIVLSGSSKLDRTTFGMSPSSKIGNVVDFNFDVKMNLD
ncbi:MAG: YceI family protein [Crocinitomicaceae bacterium]|nr:YceI family protein [Crocinitomicaceae bacterium]